MKTNLNIKFLLTFSIISISGCITGIDATRSPSQCNSDQDCEPGLVYYLPVPYLVVQELPGDKWDARIEFMVDDSKEYTLQPYQIMASSTSIIEFNSDGTLKKFQLDGDATEVPDAVVKGIKEVGLKKLELEKKKNEEKSGARVGNGSNFTGKEGKLFMYKINGSTLKPMTVKQSMGVKGHVVTMILPDPEPPKEEVKGEFDDAKDNFVLFGTPTGLKPEDVDKLVFLKSDNTSVKGVTTTSIVKEIDLDLVKRSGKIVIPITKLRSNKVSFIVLGEFKIGIPNP